MIGIFLHQLKNLINYKTKHLNDCTTVFACLHFGVKELNFKRLNETNLQF